MDEDICTSTKKSRKPKSNKQISNSDETEKLLRAYENISNLFSPETINESNKYWNYINCYHQAIQPAHEAALKALEYYNQTAEKTRKIKKTKKQITTITPPANDLDEFEFEISEEFIKFYETSLKHKSEKRSIQKEQQKDSQNQQSKNELESNKNVPPLERVGAEREEALKSLYGNKSNLIHLIETRLQMKFDKNLDVYQPTYWPSFPLKTKFTD